MSRLIANIPPPRKKKAYDPSPMRHPSLTPQWKWAQKYVTDQRFMQRTLFLGYSNFKILARFKKGPAELIRLLLSFAGIPYEDHILRDVDWKCLLCKMPYGNLPVMWIDHNVYGEPNAIIRNLARHLGLLGTTEVETLVVEAVLHQVQDLKESEVMQKAYEELQERPDDNVEQVMQVLLPSNFKYWENHIMASAGPFIASSGISVADMAVFDFIDQHRKYIPLDTVLADYKAVSQLCSSVKSHPLLVHYFRHGIELNPSTAEYEWHLVRKCLDTI